MKIGMEGGAEYVNLWVLNHQRVCRRGVGNKMCPQYRVVCTKLWLQFPGYDKNKSWPGNWYTVGNCQFTPTKMCMMCSWNTHLWPQNWYDMHCLSTNWSFHGRLGRLGKRMELILFAAISIFHAGCGNDCNPPPGMLWPRRHTYYWWICRLQLAVLSISLLGVLTYFTVEWSKGDLSFVLNYVESCKYCYLQCCCK